MLCRKGLKITEADKNRNGDKFRFQGQYARPQRWFDLGFDWIEVNFSTCEPDLYRKIFQTHDKTQDTNTLNFFKSQSEIQNVLKNLGITVSPQCSDIVKSH